MSEFTETERKLLKASKSLFWKYGLSRVTIEEICDHAKVSKMSFYRYFKNKDAIAEVLIVQMFNNSKKHYDKIMQSDDDFGIKVNQLIELKQRDIKGISEDFITDIYRKDNSSLAQKIQELSQQSLNQIKKDFIDAQQKGEIRKDLNIDFMMYMLDDLNKKLLDKELLKHFKSEEELIMEVTNFFFYGILP